MTTSEIKTEINKVIDHLPEDFLNEVLAYLRQIDNTDPNLVKRAMHLKQILIEDRLLLQKLAQ